MKRNKLIYFTILVLSLCLFSSVNGFAQKLKSGGVTLYSGVSSLGTAEWRYRNSLRIRPYFSNEIGYSHQTIFSNQKLGFDYGFHIRHSRYRVEDYFVGEVCVRGEGSISIPINLIYGKSIGNKYWYVGAGIALDHAFYECKNYSYYVHYTSYLGDDGHYVFSQTEYTGKEAKAYNYCLTYIFGEGLWGDLSMSGQVKFGFIQNFKENHAIGVTLNYQMLDLISLFDDRSFGERDSDNNAIYYYPMNFSFALTWYFKSIL